MRLAAWNVWWRFGDWRARQPGLVATLAAVDADVVALNEAFTAPDDDQPARLASALGLDHVLESHRWRGSDGVSIGNALLSRWPIATVHDVGLPGPHGRYRTLLAADVEAPDGTWRVATTHLAHRRRDRGWRRVQVAEVDELLRVGARAHPVVLAGDLNAAPDEREMRWLARWGWTDLVAAAGLDHEPTVRSDNPHTAVAAFPDRRLDHVWALDAEASHLDHLGRDPVDGLHPSDHAGFVLDLVRPGAHPASAGPPHATTPRRPEPAGRRG